MSQYLYVIIPCNRKRFSKAFVESLKKLSPSIIDDGDILTIGNGFLSINTCVGMNALTIFNEEGVNYLRQEMLEVAKYLKADEFWYIDELTYEEFYGNDFSFEDWIEKTYEELSYCTMEYEEDKIKEGRIASIVHEYVMLQ